MLETCSSNNYTTGTLTPCSLQVGTWGQQRHGHEISRTRAAKRWEEVGVTHGSLGNPGKVTRCGRAMQGLSGDPGDPRF